MPTFRLQLHERSRPEAAKAMIQMMYADDVTLINGSEPSYLLLTFDTEPSPGVVNESGNYGKVARYTTPGSNAHMLK